MEFHIQPIVMAYVRVLDANNNVCTSVRENVCSCAHRNGWCGQAFKGIRNDGTVLPMIGKIRHLRVHGTRPRGWLLYHSR